MSASSLTSPADRIPGEVVNINAKAPHLTDEETKSAMKDLFSLSLTKNYPPLERQYLDPPVDFQNYGLFSFVPSKGAKPDKDGVFGMAKVRGSYQTIEECTDRAEKIAREVDSYHQINTFYVGRPFPVVANADKYSKDVNVIDIKNKVVEVLADDMKDRRAQERKDIEEAKEREKRLLDSQNKELPEEPIDRYTTLCVKKAQLTFTFKDNIEKLKTIKKNIEKAKEEIREMELTHPEFKDEMYERYMEARRTAGIKNDDGRESFIKYLCEDIDLNLTV